MNQNKTEKFSILLFCGFSFPILYEKNFVLIEIPVFLETKIKCFFLLLSRYDIQNENEKKLVFMAFFLLEKEKEKPKSETLVFLFSVCLTPTWSFFVESGSQTKHNYLGKKNEETKKNTWIVFFHLVVNHIK